MAVPELRKTCPCSTVDSMYLPCENSTVSEGATTTITLSGIDDFGWTTSDNYTINGQKTYPFALTGIDGTYTLKYYNSETATALEKMIYDRLVLIKGSSDTCITFIGMPETLTFNSVLMNPEASDSVTDQYKTIACFPLVGVFVGTDIFTEEKVSDGSVYDDAFTFTLNSSNNKIIELVVELGALSITDAREEFPYTTMTPQEYLDLKDELNATTVADLPGWAARRASNIQLRCPLYDIGDYSFSPDGVYGGQSSTDGTRARYFRRYHSYGYLNSAMAGNLIFSTTYDYGIPDSPDLTKPTIYPSSLYWTNGFWESSNPKNENETDDEYYARKSEEFLDWYEGYEEYLELLEEYNTAWDEWKAVANSSYSDWDKGLGFVAGDDSDGWNDSIYGWFSGIIEDGINVGWTSYDKPDIYPRTASFELNRIPCSIGGQGDLYNVDSEETESCVAWKFNGVPIVPSEGEADFEIDPDGNVIPPDIYTPPYEPEPDDPNPNPDDPNPDDPNIIEGCDCFWDPEESEIWVDKHATTFGDGSQAFPYVLIDTAMRIGNNRKVRVVGYGPDDPYDELEYYLLSGVTCRWLTGEKKNGLGCYFRSISGFDCSKFEDINTIGTISYCTNSEFTRCSSTAETCFSNCTNNKYTDCTAITTSYGFYRCGGEFISCGAEHQTATEEYASGYGFYECLEESTFTDCYTKCLQYGFRGCVNVTFDGVVVDYSYYAFYQCTGNTFADVEVRNNRRAFWQCYDSSFEGVDLVSSWEYPFYYCYNSTFDACSVSGLTANYSQTGSYSYCYDSTFTDCEASDVYKGWSNCSGSTFDNCHASDKTAGGFDSCANSSFTNCSSSGGTTGFGGCSGSTWSGTIAVSDGSDYAFSSCGSGTWANINISNNGGGFSWGWYYEEDDTESSTFTDCTVSLTANSGFEGYTGSSFSDCAVTSSNESNIGHGFSSCGSNSTFINCTADGTSRGFSSCGDNSTFTDCVASNIIDTGWAGQGWHTGSDSTFTNCKATGCATTGFRDCYRCTFTGGISSYNGGSGWDYCNDSTYIECDASSNSGGGFGCDESTFTDCTATLNSGIGFACDSPVSMTNCEGVDNGTSEGATGSTPCNFLNCDGATNCTSIGGLWGFYSCDNLNNCYAEGATRPDDSNASYDGRGFRDCDWITNCEATGNHTGFGGCKNISNCSGHNNIGCGFAYDCTGATSCSSSSQHSLECSGCTAYGNCSTHDPCYRGSDDGNDYSEEGYVYGCDSCAGYNKGFDYEYDDSDFGPC